MKEPFSHSVIKTVIRFQEKLIAYLEKGKKPERVERVPLSGEAVDLDTAHRLEDEVGVTYYSTENSQLSRNAQKAPAFGIDKFGEEDTFDPEEADEHQTARDRNQNSDLSKRFYTDGMDLDDFNKSS